MKRPNLLALILMLALSVVAMAACSTPAASNAQNLPPAAAPTTAPVAQPTAMPTAAPVAQPTTMPTAASTAAPSGQAVTLQVVTNDKLGSFLADGDGKTLYLYTKDTKNTSNCYDKCAQVWPPLISSAQPTLKDGVSKDLLGTTTRKDGSVQITYNGWPLYYYAADKNAGDTNGQAIGKVWWVESPEGNIIKPSGLQVVTNDKLGKFLADENGRSLYMFTKDTKDTSNCYGKCEVAWPPLLTTGQPVLQDGVDSKLLGTTKRKDGSMQVTYNGMPLYYYVPDAKPGDVNGQGVGSVWYVVAPDGSVIK